MSHVVFENAGEIEPRLISTFGVNVKESDDAIGFFGTGLKYALAILARNGCGVVIQSGEQAFTFGKQTVEIRGKAFEFVTMDGEPMGFTTEVGKQWDLWMAYRELYCNAKDESGRVYMAAEPPAPSAGITRVIVTGEPFAAVARDHGRYFLTTEPRLQMKGVHVHPGSSTGIYYRGILVGKLSDAPMRHTYNIVSRIDLTEDRVMKHPFEVTRVIAVSVLQSDDPAFITDCVTSPDDYHESRMDFDWPSTPSETFMQTMALLIRDRFSKINQTALAVYRKNAPKTYDFDEVALNAIEQATLEKALGFCREIGFDIKYPVRAVESLGPEVLGLAADGQIFLAHRAFMIGTKAVAGTLIEEYVHLKHGLADCTRGLQNYLLDRLVSMGERVVGEPL